MQKESSMIVDTVESLEAKIKEVKEAQKIFATYTQEQVDNIFKAAAMAATKQESVLQNKPLQRLVWALLRIRLSKITMPQSIFTMLIKM